MDDRAALRGIVYVLCCAVLCKSVSWRDVPAEQVGCSGVTAWRRLLDWTEAGVWPQLHEVLLTKLRAAGLFDVDDAAIDGSHIRALKGGLTPDLRRLTGPARRQTGSDRRPRWPSLGRLADRRKSSRCHPAHASAGRDTRIRGIRKWPRHRSRRLFVERGYNYESYRRLLRARGITPKVARRGTRMDPDWKGHGASSSGPSPGPPVQTTPHPLPRYGPASISHCSNSPEASPA